MISAKLMHAEIYWGRLVETNFSHANLTKISISSFSVEASFRNAILKEADFLSCELQGAKFNDSNLDNTEFLNCDLEGVHFNGAIIKRVSVNASKVTRAAFSPEQVGEVSGFEKGE